VSSVLANPTVKNSPFYGLVKEQKTKEQEQKNVDLWWDSIKN